MCVPLEAASTVLCAATAAVADGAKVPVFNAFSVHTDLMSRTLTLLVRAPISNPRCVGCPEMASKV